MVRRPSLETLYAVLVKFGVRIDLYFSARMDIVNRVDDRRSSMNRGIDSSFINWGLSRLCKSVLSTGLSKWRKPLENEVMAVAARTFRRFYSSSGLSEFDPTDVFLVCLSLACKSEEFHNISLADIAGPFGRHEMPNSVQIELSILSVTDFNFELHQPWPTILWLVSKISERSHREYTGALFEKSCELLNSWLWTDVILVIEFPVLATVAVERVCRDLGATETFHKVIEDHQVSLTREELAALSTSIDDIIGRHVRPELAELDSFVNSWVRHEGETANVKRSKRTNELSLQKQQNI